MSRIIDQASRNVLYYQIKNTWPEAQISWYLEKNQISIQIKAPPNQRWVFTGTQVLQADIDKAIPNCRQELVQNLLIMLQQGLIGAGDPDTHGDCCECQTCENFEPELEEIQFDHAYRDLELDVY